MSEREVEGGIETESGRRSTCCMLLRVPALVTYLYILFLNILTLLEGR